MIIEDVEALKKWLMDTVAPICDADPEPLSRYCLALVKKDKPEAEHKEFCLEQLDVFLQNKTAAFVDTLFDALKSKAYLGAAKSKTDSTENRQETPTSTTDDVKIKEEKPEDQIKRSNSKEEQKDLRDVIRKRHGSRSPSPRRRDFSDDRRRRMDDRRIRRRSRSRSPFRRRSPRGWSPRSPRGRSRSPRGRSPRNWSPPRGRSPRMRSRSPRGRSPRRIGSRESPRKWSRSPRSWSPRQRSPGLRSPKGRRRSRSWSRSKSRSRSRSPVGKRDSRGSTPTLDNGKYQESSIPVMGVTVYSTTRTEPTETKPLTAAPRPRCKDYDEQGFCMRGDLCPYDHGTDPVIVDDVPIPSFPASGPPTSRAPPVPPHGGPPPVMPHQRPEHFEPYNPEAPAMSRPPPYWTGPPPGLNAPPPGPPGPPGMFMMHGPPLPPNMQSQGQRQRDLVNIRTMPDQQKDGVNHPPHQNEPVHVPPSTSQTDRTVIAPKRPYNNDRPYGQPPAKKPFDFSRVGGYRKPGANNTNTTLEIRKVPREMNNITKLNEFFGKFGTLTNVQVAFEGDPEGALITFSSNAEAFAAYRSPEPVFNNRFIKVFWHKTKDNTKDQSEESDSTASDPTSTTPAIPSSKPKDQRNVKLRVEIPPAHKMSLNNTTKQSDPTKPAVEKSIVYTPSLGVITKTVYNPKAQAPNKPKILSPTAVGSAQFVSKIEAIKKQEDLKKEAAKKKAEIQKQKQELLQKQIEQQKKLIEKLEKNKSLSADDKDKIKKTLKILTDSIEKLTKEVVPLIKKSTPPVTPELPVITSPEQAKKEILDTELELFNKQQSGEDTIALRKKLNELTKQASAMGLLSRGRGRGSFPRGGRGRGFPGRGSMTWVAGGRGASNVSPFGRGSSQFPPASQSRSLDNRPKQIEVTGFSSDQKELLQNHFKMFGNVDRVDFDDVDNSAIVTFRTRQDAEYAFSRGSKFQDSVLTMKWHTGVKINIRLNVSSDESYHADAIEGNDETNDDLDEEALLADEDALLGGEDEEEEDEESRSWRR